MSEIIPPPRTHTHQPRHLPSVSQRVAAAVLPSSRLCGFFGVRAVDAGVYCRAVEAPGGNHRDLSVYWHFGSFSQSNQRKSVQT